MLKTFFSLCVFCALVLPPLSAQSAETVFKGRPQLQIMEAARNRAPIHIAESEADHLECVISKIGRRYYWASRENREMVRVESEGFITFVAVDGSGYVRLFDPHRKSSTSLASGTEDKFDYVEHVLTGLRSMSYYGITRLSK
ncbi:MAG TPA: hypothetical protein VFO52_06130 [Longimicrobiales bacterium]|nr:hypothetical protein [Longimicrobiales bacterium]